MQGANARLLAKAEKFLSDFQHVRIDPFVCDTAIELIRKHSHKNGLRLADALIAATCIENDMPLLTTNRRHFESISDLELL